MVNVTYSEVSGDPTYYMADGTPALYNLGDMAWMLTYVPLSPLRGTLPCSFSALNVHESTGD
jgi:hypothetical protein